MTIHEILKQYWNFPEFRPLQEDIIRSVLSGDDTLALLPTGGGKSVCFQLPALAKPGICIVVSPLIALMKDQVENLKARGIEAVAVFSGMGKREIDILLDNCIYGPVKFLYLSPERLLSDLVRERIKYMKVNLIAVDEAHCISQWGYDFRPPYLRINELRALHPGVPVLALTATATARVVTDIQEKLAFKRPNVFRKSFERKNLTYVVSTEEDKYRKLFAIVKSVQGSGIVYVRNRQLTQEVARALNRAGISSDYYHAGLVNASRSQKQESWKKNEIRVMVATNAFGMGIDKPDVRFVVHLDSPENLEAYYQEAGRAGRDEKRAYAVLLSNQSDWRKLREKFEKSFPELEEIRQVYHCLGNFYQLAYGAGEELTFDFDIAQFCSRFHLDPIKTLNTLKFLEQNEYLGITESVFLPSRLKFVVNPEEIYKFQIANGSYDRFIKTLLRSYGGLFEQFCPVREDELSRRAGLSQKEVAGMLNKLQELQLISYLPQTDQPQLTFLKPRVDARDLWIDARYIRERKEVVGVQVEAVIRYAETNECRNVQLLRYFDEKDPAKCGLCDVCLEEKRQEKRKLIAAGIRAAILDLLQEHGALPLQELVRRIGIGSEKERVTVIRDLTDAGQLKIDGFNYSL